jgi:hypothetical protein
MPLLLAAAAVGLATGLDAPARAQAPSPEIVAELAPDDAAPDHIIHPFPRYPWPRIPYPYPFIPSGCATPIAPLPPGGLPVPPGVTPRPSPTSLPSPTPGGPAGGAMSTTYRVCPQVEEEIPDHVKQHALAEPWSIYGFGKLRNPNTPYHPLWNSWRRNLSLRNFSQPFSVCNPAIWKAGCP